MRLAAAGAAVGSCNPGMVASGGDEATKTPISLLFEGETAGAALDAFSSAARALELSQCVIVARGSPGGAQSNETGADDDFAKERRGPVGLDLAIKDHRTGLAFDAFQTMKRTVLDPTPKPITVARILAQVRAGPRRLPRSVEFLRRCRRVDDQVSDPQLRLLHVDAGRKLFQIFTERRTRGRGCRILPRRFVGAWL